MTAIEIHELRREFRAKRGDGSVTVALDDVNLEIAPGSVYGLLGPNGAGKTTLVRVLSTVLLPTSGTASVLGYDVVDDTADVRRRIGLVFGGDRGLYTRLTARQNLVYWAALYGVSSSDTSSVVDALLRLVGLADRADERVETYSSGMKQRLHLARGLVSDPSVLFLDEPTAGLDPIASAEFRVLIEGLQEAGKTVFLTTHNMAEAEALCDRVSLIDHGRILKTESPATLARWMSRYEWVEGQHVDADVIVELDIPGVQVEHRADGWVRFQPDEDGLGQRVLERLVASGVTSVRTGSPSLEDVYLEVIGDRGMQV